MPTTAISNCTMYASSPSMSASSCPTCEYTGCNTDIRHESVTGLHNCQICGTKWREIDSKPKKPHAVENNPRRAAGKSVKPGSIAATFFAIMLLAAGLYTNPDTLLLQTYADPNSDMSRNNLEIGDVSVESYMNSNRPIWVVTGKVINNSPHELNVPPLTMHSGKKGSSGYIKWTYRAALQKLAPGASFRFRTTIRKPSGSAQEIKLKFGAT